MSRFIAIYFLGFLLACNSNDKTNAWPYVANLVDVELNNLKGEIFNWDQLKNNKANVFVFISPECPLCENYSKTIKTLQNKYAEDNISWQAIVAGQYYPTEQIDSFLKVYEFDITVLLDEKYEMASYFKASVTPEVFVIDENLQTAYEGKIDNWIYKLGIKRPNITEFYLDDALKALLNNEEILIKRTDAVGCLIE